MRWLSPTMTYSIIPRRLITRPIWRDVSLEISMICRARSAVITARRLEPFLVKIGQASFYEMIESLGVSVDLYWHTSNLLRLRDQFPVNFHAGAIIDALEKDGDPFLAVELFFKNTAETFERTFLYNDLFALLE